MLALLIGGIEAGEEGVDDDYFSLGDADGSNLTKAETINAEVLKDERALRHNLLKDYDKSFMPSINTTVTVIEISIQSLKMHESEHVMEVLARLTMVWTDPRLKWDLATNENVGFLGMDPKSIWTPDLTVYNAAASTHVSRSTLPMIVYPKDGTILYTSPYNFEFTCAMDLTYWPHDIQNCSLKLGSWVHQGHLLDLFLKDNKVEIEIPTEMKSSGLNFSAVEWIILETTVSREETVYPCCAEHLTSLLITFVVERNAPVYSWTIKLPIVCLSVLTLILFLLPPAAGEKLIFGGLCLTMNLIYIAYTSSVISHAPSHTPLIIRLVSQQVVLVTLSLVVSAMVVRIARDPRCLGLPSLIKRILVGFSYPLCLRSYRNLITYTNHTFEFDPKPDEMNLETGDGSERQNRLSLDGCEWLLLVAVLDRLLFFLYAVICIISFIRFSYVL